MPETMAEQVTLQFPDGAFSALRRSPADFSDEVKRAAVCKWYELGVISQIKAAELARKHWISEATLYNWKAKFGGMHVSDAKRLPAPEEENAKLKKLLAETMLGASPLRQLLTKYVGSAVKREAVVYMRERFQI